MPFTEVKAPPKPAGPGTGISFGLSAPTKGGTQTVRLTFNAERQEQLFGGSIEGKAVSIGVGRGSDDGLLQVRICEDGPLTATNAMKGSVSVKMAAWDLLPKEKRPAAALTIKEVPNQSTVVLYLPDWACRAKVGKTNIMGEPVPEARS